MLRRLWQGDRQIIKAASEVTRSVRLQRLHVFYALIIVLFVILLIFVVQNKRQLFADEPQIDESYDYSGGIALTVPITIEENGQVLINGETATHKIFQPLPNFDEFRYKVIDRPETFIDSIKVRLTFPRPIEEGIIYRSYAVHGIDKASEKKIDEYTVEYLATGIGPEASLTIVAQVPKGQIEWPAWRIVMAALVNLPAGIWIALALLLPFLTGLVLIIMFWPALRPALHRFFSGGKRQLALSEASLSVSLPTSLPSPSLPPALVGILVYGRISARELAATILDLAQRRYITIFNQDSQHFTFAKGRAWQGLAPFELQLLMQLFHGKNYKSSDTDIELSVGDGLFSPTIARIYLAMYDSAVASGYFKYNPSAIHAKYRLIGLLFFFVGLFAFTFVMVLALEPAALLFLFAGMMTMALVIILSADSVPLLTAKGEAAKNEWLDFQVYLRDQSEISYSEGAQLYYERFLPYAAVLHSELQWVNRFRRHPFVRPVWYDAPDKTITMEDFANNIYRIVGTIAQLFSAAKEPTVH